MARAIPLVLIAGLALAGCRAAPALPPDPANPADPGADACGAVRLQHLVGQPESVLQGMRFDAPVRIIRPGMAVTMDYRPDRLNIEIDARNRIARAHCS
ncbi:I78 family peptidase inhibitor [Pontitalea aquivivens]|uniref:I78 family peptidase inhibitor n=1 Tax=Pontitalea aquivivens TaxID=3388663 RepID=UPI003970A828